VIYLCCDTNIWINISNGLEPPRLLDRLYDEIRGNNIKLLLPEIIKTEWNRNKDKFIITQTKASTNNHIENLGNLNEFLENELDFPFFLWGDEEESESTKLIKLRDKINELRTELKKHKAEILNKAKKNIERVEEIFNHPNTVLLQTDEKTSLTVVKLAIEKKFPFENGKNNFADCLIFHQFVNYLEENNIKGGHFVTSNKKEFFPNDKLHVSLQVKIDLSNSHFYKSLSEALNTTLNEDLVNERELKWVEELSGIDEEYLCEVCDTDDGVIGTLNFNNEISIADLRKRKDKNQLSIEFDGLSPDEVVEYKQEEITKTECGFCNNCGTEHIACPECGEIWNFISYKKNKIQHCEGCDLSFKYIEEVDRKGMIENSYVELLDDTDICGNCGDEFNSSITGIDICEKCNEAYINN